MTAEPIVRTTAEYADALAELAQMRAAGGRAKWFSGRLAPHVEACPIAKTARCEIAFAELAAMARKEIEDRGELKPSKRNIAVMLARWLRRYNETGWRQDRGIARASLTGGPRQRALFAVMSIVGAIGEERIRKILPDARITGDSVGKFDPIAITHADAHG